MRIPKGQSRPEFPVPEKPRRAGFDCPAPSESRDVDQTSPVIEAANYKPKSGETISFATVSRGFLVSRAFSATWDSFVELGFAGRNLNYKPIIIVGLRVDNARRAATLASIERGDTYLCMADDDIEVERINAFPRLLNLLESHPGAFAAIGHVLNKTSQFTRPYRPPDNVFRRGSKQVTACGFALAMFRVAKFLEISEDPNKWWGPGCKSTGRGEDTQMACLANRSGFSIHDDIETWAKHYELATYRGAMPGHPISIDTSYARPHGFTVYGRKGTEKEA